MLLGFFITISFLIGLLVAILISAIGHAHRAHKSFSESFNDIKDDWADPF